MTLKEKIMVIYPSLTMDDFSPKGTIALQNDSDGNGDYIKLWSHLTFTEPTEEQLGQ
jgi:hypothetical protein